MLFRCSAFIGVPSRHHVTSVCPVTTVTPDASFLFPLMKVEFIIFKAFYSKRLANPDTVTLLVTHVASKCWTI